MTLDWVLTLSLIFLTIAFVRLVQSCNASSPLVASLYFWYLNHLIERLCSLPFHSARLNTQSLNIELDSALSGQGVRLPFFRLLLDILRYVLGLALVSLDLCTAAHAVRIEVVCTV